MPAALGADVLILVLAFLDARRAPEVRAHRRIHGSPRLNGTLDVELRLDGPEGVEVRITDDLGPGLVREAARPDLTGAAVVALTDARGAAWDASTPAGGRGVLGAGGGHAAYRLRTPNRGDHHLGDLHLRVRGRLGLAWAREVVPARETVRVQPGMDELRRARMAALQRRVQRAGLRRMRQFGDGTEFESLREYAVGDDPRTVDWKASARRTSLLVRNYEAERSQTLVLAIDAGRLMREWIDDRERLDFALASALLLTERARAFGDRVGLMVFDRDVRLLLPPGPVNLARIANLLADVRARPVEPNYPLAFAALNRAFRKRSLVVLFSEVIDGQASNPLVQSMTRVARHHLPLMVALRNPDVESMAEAPVVDEADVWGRGAAEELLGARAVALRGMRRSGVQVVDTAPGASVESTLARYVEIKERGLL
ncbi:MAG TPA: DUF58 domain-containing protein [Longimicrobiales bacterium]|nr:DUF58 domain-containing protein [Longimicrobiales bacterium]